MAPWGRRVRCAARARWPGRAAEALPCPGCFAPGACSSGWAHPSIAALPLGVTCARLSPAHAEEAGSRGSGEDPETLGGMASQWGAFRWAQPALAGSVPARLDASFARAWGLGFTPRPRGTHAYPLDS